MDALFTPGYAAFHPTAKGWEDPDGQIEARASAPARYAWQVKIGLRWLRHTAHTVESNDAILTVVVSKIAAPTLFTAVVRGWAQAHCDALQDPGSCLANSYV